jgi:hypothetical protein
VIHPPVATVQDQPGSSKSIPGCVSSKNLAFAVKSL